MSTFRMRLRSAARMERDAPVQYPRAKMPVICEEFAYMPVSLEPGVKLQCTSCKCYWHEVPPPPSAHDEELAAEFTRRVDAGEDIYEVFHDTMSRKEGWDAPDLCIHCRSPGGWFSVIGPVLEKPTRIVVEHSLDSFNFYAEQTAAPMAPLSREWCVSAILSRGARRSVARGIG
jgi:hypothetical protein